MLPHLRSGCVLPDAGPGVRALPGGPAPGPPPPGCLRFPAVPAQQWRPCSYRDPVRPGGGPLAVGRVLLPTPRTPQGSPGHGPGAPERPHAARRRRLRLSTACIELGGSGSVVRAAVPSAPESRSRLFSVEKTGNFARLRQAEQATSRLTGRRHPLSRRKWKQLPIFACRRCTTACLLWPAGTTNQLHRVFLHHTVSEADSLGFRRQEARPI